MHSYGRDYDPLATWGSFSTPSESAGQMHLDTELSGIPRNGVVVDLGAGAGLSLSASIFVRRPDLRVVSVDPGFAFVEVDRESFDEGLEATIGFFEPEQQATLRASREWRDGLVSGLAEDLPLADGLADAVVSYSCVPHYSLDKAVVLAETLRVLKVGGVGLNGPMLDQDFEVWDAAIREAVGSGAVTAYSHWTETLVTTYGYEMDAHFTRIVK